MIIHETLAELGMSNRQTDIYLSLLKLGPSSIRDIAAAVDINRGTVYEELKRLRTMSLVTYFPQGKRRFFCAEPPEVLVRRARRVEKKTTSAADRLENEILPDLKQIMPDISQTSVFHYEGDEGVEYLLRDILETVSDSDEKNYRVYSSRHIRKYLYRPFPGFTNARVKAGIHVNVIAIGEGGEDAPLSNRKWIEDQTGEQAASYVAIYGSKCAMISLVGGDYQTVVILDSEGISSAMKISFDTLWERL
ncbi:MAG: ArsR family transcriptional regulator [Pseudomonadales bacterium]|nr:ArsR family transcriptional regulator [Pseudomonadales bacterium]MBO6594968.1 ArsR family transcriptional regulator [Pseudomonadales bacterium]MBO6657471.1 ArsR family transcriptional regulator [Pseudomonadales bacterium]MBO6821473.1 ArsR family transcriptional regulator [Pseudomonadales bacterium]